MNNLKILLGNKIIILTFIGLLVLSLFFTGTVAGLLNEQNKEFSFIDEMDWIFPLGEYDRIQIAEAENQVVFIVESAGWKAGTERYYKLMNPDRSISDCGWRLDNADVSSRLEVKLHPEGYYVNRNEYNNGEEHIESVRGNHMTWFQYGASLMLTEVPGYAIDMITGKVIEIKNGDDITVYEPNPDERVVKQMGEFWILEKEIPWPGGPLTVMYLRDMDFQIALNGMLFDGIYDIDEDRIACDVITSGTYYQLPEEVIAVDWRVMKTSGEIIYPPSSEQDVILLSADQGYWFAVEDHEHRRMYFHDGTAPIDFEENEKPVGPCQNGMFVFVNKAGKYGVMDKKGYNNIGQRKSHTVRRKSSAMWLFLYPI